MRKQVTIGGLEKGAFFAAQLELPILSTVEAVDWIVDALDHAATERKGVAVVGAKGAGKTVALQHAIEDFEEAERLAAAEDASYERRRLVKVLSPQSRSRYEILATIWEAALGMEPRRVRGQRKSEDQLFKELVELLLEQRVTVLVFDEAENLSDEALRVIRDIISATESLSRQRFTGRTYKPAGVGALLLGTPSLKNRLVRSEEAGRRWVRIHELDLLDPAQVATTYLEFFPAWREHVAEIGEDAWVDFIRLNVCRGRAIPVGRVENHARGYARRFAAENSDITDRSEVKFDAELFEYTLKELAEYRPEDE